MMPEGLWWNHADGTFQLKRRESWRWTLFMVVPDFVSPKMLAAVRTEIRKKKKPVPSLDKGTA